MGALGYIRKATIPQSALRLTPLTRPGPSVAARHLPTLWGVTLCTREPPSTPIEFLLAPEGSMWEEYKAPLRKCSHSCIFRRFVL